MRWLCPARRHHPLGAPAERTLRYTAALRRVPDPERAVDDVLRTLELAGRSVVPVGHLSGGERKRASIAAELLARPGLFFLDEPTSGLDPARGMELMRTLRRLCDSGTTVVLTTHNPLDAEVCDKVAVLASGGHLAFFGTLAAARGYFGTDSTVEIYERLAGIGDPEKNWSRRYFDAHVTWTTPAVSPASAVGDAREAAGTTAATGTATLDPGDVLDRGIGDGGPDGIAARIPAQSVRAQEGQNVPGQARHPRGPNGRRGRFARHASGRCSPSATPTPSPAASSPPRCWPGRRSRCCSCSWCCSGRVPLTRHTPVPQRPS